MRKFLLHAGIAGSLTAAWIIAQPQTPGTTGELAFPKLSTPFTCGAGRTGRVYYDTDDDTPYYCDGSTWQPFGVTISGTHPYAARFTSGGTNVETSQWELNDMPAAGVSSNGLALQEALAAMDGSDTVRGILVNFTNASHTGSSNKLRGIEIGSISGSSNAQEIAYIAGTGWDASFYSEGGAFNVNGINPPSGSNWSLLKLGGTLSALNGNDRVSIVDGNNLSNANHTGSANYVNFIYVGDITEDAQATETAIYVNATWDSFLTTTAKSASWDAPDEPSSNTVAFYVDESVDRSVGTATADCALIARLSSGTEVVVSVLVTDGGCP